MIHYGAIFIDTHLDRLHTELEEPFMDDANNLPVEQVGAPPLLGTAGSRACGA